MIEAFATQDVYAAESTLMQTLAEGELMARAVEGQLTLKGQTHPVTLQARQFNCYVNPMLKRDVCGGDFEVTIDRTLWGVTYGLPMVAPKEVRILATVEAIRQ